MKSFLCLLLIAFIACESIDKNNEIVLKDGDFIDEFFDKMVSALDEYKNDQNCFSDKMSDYFSTLTPDQYSQISTFQMSEECHDVCYDKLSKIDSTLRDQICLMCVSIM